MPASLVVLSVAVRRQGEYCVGYAAHLRLFPRFQRSDPTKHPAVSCSFANTHSLLATYDEPKKILLPWPADPVREERYLRCYENATPVAHGSCEPGAERAVLSEYRGGPIVSRGSQWAAYIKLSYTSYSSVARRYNENHERPRIFPTRRKKTHIRHAGLTGCGLAKIAKYVKHQCSCGFPLISRIEDCYAVIPATVQIESLQPALVVAKSERSRQQERVAGIKQYPTGFWPWAFRFNGESSSWPFSTFS